MLFVTGWVKWRAWLTESSLCEQLSKTTWRRRARRRTGRTSPTRSACSALQDCSLLRSVWAEDPLSMFYLSPLPSGAPPLQALLCHSPPPLFQKNKPYIISALQLGWQDHPQEGTTRRFSPGHFIYTISLICSNQNELGWREGVMVSHTTGIPEYMALTETIRTSEQETGRGWATTPRFYRNRENFTENGYYVNTH